ncbi:lytic murein transglycosylase [Niveispirillum lacus]|uniref:Lytic murein transglycosylase n=1 Tax=Niveispirillum lacus TaxID=1981099 RepID=A0A255YWE4_9PROT|nr:lytic transglycosylase domain-containing protein [Niveispirillum lacus]OYQ33553.1 lytic murein transglycosylase [Niveispirillum lacus]
MKARTLNSRNPRNKAAGRALAAMLLCLGIGLGGIGLAQAAGTTSEVGIYKQALRAADQGKMDEAQRIARRAPNDLANQLLLWMQLTQPGSDASWEAITGFMQRHPDWPNQAALRRNAEARMPADMSYGAVRDWFDKNPPLTWVGVGRYADALMETGASDKAIALIRERYVNGSFGAQEERDFRQRYAGLLGPADHADRLDQLLWAEKVDEARRVMPLVDPGRQAVAEARIALAAMSPGVDGALRRVPASLQNDPGLLYDRTRWRRRKEMNDSALDVLARPQPEEQAQAADWWTERHILARRLMEQEQFARAYDIVAAHAAKDGLAFAQAEFLAGWLALRKLDRPDQALRHFETLFRGTASPVSRSRGAYWAGRALEALGDRERAATWFDTATTYGGTFYGLLAADHLDRPPGSAMPVEPTPSEEQRRAFNKRDMVRVIHLLSRVEGSDSDRTTLFMRKLATDAKTGEEYQLVGELALSLKRKDLAVTTSRAAWQDGFVLRHAGFPLLDMKAPSRPEAALIHGIIRQESNFVTTAVSSAGARGLMQVMPATAVGVNKQAAKPAAKNEKAKKQDTKQNKPPAKQPSKITATANRLTADPRYNVETGSTYLADLVDRFGGSYVLAIAAYNAGPGRVSGWVRDYGDPRVPEVDVIDWIETMPIYETRNYVQRVLENVHLYRARLGQPSLRMTLDLGRGAATNG